MQATNEAHKNFFKLMINSLYGKTMENTRKRINIRIVAREKDCLKYSSKPIFINSIIYGKILVALHKKPEEIRLNRLIYVGCAVLEESKLEMYKFWYNSLKKVCKEIKLIYMDTDSFIFEVTNQNFNDTMLADNEYFDLTVSHKDSKYYDPTSKKVPGKMKDGRPSQNNAKVFEIKSKSNTIITSDIKEECKYRDLTITLPAKNIEM